MVVGAVVGRQGNDWSRQDISPFEDFELPIALWSGRHPITLTLTEGAPGCKETGGKRCKSANGGFAGAGGRGCLRLSKMALHPRSGSDYFARDGRERRRLSGIQNAQGCRGVACVRRMGIVRFQIGASGVICIIDHCLVVACGNGVARQGLGLGERLMKSIVVVGAQWGDEGKGKVVDYLAASFDYIARLAGGHNAGQRYHLQRAPRPAADPLRNSAPEQACRHWSGVVVDPSALVAELETLEKGRNRRRRAAAPLQSRAPDLSLSPRNGKSRGNSARRGENRHDIARHRSGLRRQNGAARDPHRAIC